MNPAQKVLLLTALWYLISGGIYSYRSHGEYMLTPMLALVAFLGIVTGLLLTRKQYQHDRFLVQSISPNVSLKLSLYALSLVVITLSVYVFIDPSYFSSDKVGRAELVSRLFPIRFVAFTAYRIILTRCKICKRRIISG